MSIGWEFPLSTMAYIWVALVSTYCGFDRYVDIKETQNLARGQMSMGELNKLRAIIFGCFLLFVCSFLCSRFTGKDFEMAQFGSAFGMSIIIYISGNKLVKSFKYSGPDANKDGIPDIIEEEYYRWCRQQRKNGTEEKFITLDYFLDENEEARKKIKG